MAAFPSVVQTKTGNLLVLFRRAPDCRWLLQAAQESQTLSSEQYEALEGQLYHWDARSQLVSVEVNAELQASDNVLSLSLDGEAADQDVSALCLQSGDLLLSSFSWYAMPPAFAPLVESWGQRAYGGSQNVGSTFIPWGSFTRRSDNEGRSWQARRYLPALPGAPDLVPGLRTSHGGVCRGQIVEHDGLLFLPSYASVPSAGQNYSVHLYVSSSEGQDWEYRSVMGACSELGFYEPSLVVCEDGTLLCWMRTDHPEDRIASVRSHDGGHTWDAPVIHDAVGHPTHALRLKNGSIFVSYGYRHKGYGVRARVLNAEGSNIDSAPEIVIRDDGICADLGYPWAVEREDGTLFVCYYFVGSDGIRHITSSTLKFDH